MSRHSNSQQGTSVVEILVALLVLGSIVGGILPVMHQAALTDVRSEDTTTSAYVASQIMEMLKIYRQISSEGGAVPVELADFAVQEEPYEVDGEGIWAPLGIDPARFEMVYTLSTDVDSGRLLARVGVTNRNIRLGAGNRWVEFMSGIE